MRLRTILVVLVILITENFAFGQIWAAPDATWHYAVFNYFINEYTGHVIVQDIGDTLIQGKTCNILQKTKINRNIVTEELDTFALGYDYTYKDSNVVYYFRYNEFYKLYDFNSIAGSSWTVTGWDPDPIACDSFGTITVDSVSTLMINSSSLIDLKVNPQAGSNWQLGSRIVEKIGTFDTYMFPEPLFCNLDQDEGGFFNCYWDSSFGSVKMPNLPPCTYTLTISVPELQFTSTALDVFPNPTTTELNVQIDNLVSGPWNIELVSMLGKSVVLENHMRNSATISIENLSNGIYNLIATNNEGVKLSQRVVKNAP